MAIFYITIVVLVTVFGFLTLISKRHNRMNSSEVADLIDRFILGKTSEYEWDDFLSSPLNDPNLDKIRICCSQLRDKFPPKKPSEYINEEGIKVLKKCVDELRVR